MFAPMVLWPDEELIPSSDDRLTSGRGSRISELVVVGAYAVEQRCEAGLVLETAEMMENLHLKVVRIMRLRFWTGCCVTNQDAKRTTRRCAVLIPAYRLIGSQVLTATTSKAVRPLGLYTGGTCTPLGNCLSLE